MLSCWKITSFFPSSSYKNGKRRLCCSAENSQNQNIIDASQPKESRKKVLVVGSGWAGLGAAHHLCKQGFDVTVLEGGVDSGFSSYGPDEVGIQGFWYPYRNIFSLVDELGIKPFTNWMRSAQYSGEGLEVEFPVFQNVAQLPTPLGTLTQTHVCYVLKWLMITQLFTQIKFLPALRRTMLKSFRMMSAVLSATTSGSFDIASSTGCFDRF